MMGGNGRLHYADNQKVQCIQQKYKMAILKPGMQNLATIRIMRTDHRNVLTKHVSAFGISKCMLLLCQPTHQMSRMGLGLILIFSIFQQNQQQSCDACYAIALFTRSHLACHKLCYTIQNKCHGTKLIFNHFFTCLILFSLSIYI